MLDRFGPMQGWTCLDVGCGPGGITHLLSERVGASGRVVGLDTDAEFLAHARAHARKIHRTTGRVHPARGEGMPFDIKRWVEISRALDTSDIDWEEARRHPVTPVERRCLRYFAAVEAYTVVYLRDLLNTRAIEDAEVAAFLPCWAYEESYHGRALFRHDGEIVRTVRQRGQHHVRMAEPVQAAAAAYPERAFPVLQQRQRIVGRQSLALTEAFEW